MIDPNSHAFHVDPYPMFAQLRAQAPVCRVNGVGVEKFQEWFVTRYASVNELLRDTTRLINDKNSLCPPALRRNKQGKLGVEDLVTRHLITQDPPDHSRLRSLVNKAFANRNLNAFQSEVQQIADGLLDSLPVSQPVDLVEAYAAPLPLMVISHLLGVKTDDHLALRDGTMALIDLSNSQASFAQLAPRLRALVRFLDKRFTELQRRPDGSLLSDLVEARDAGDRLSKEELFNMAALLLSAGVETMVNFIGNSTRVLLQHPAQKTIFITDEENCDRAINELLRFDGPVKTTTRRWAKQDLEVEGQLIRRGEIVRLVLASANRDERVFADADLLNLRRDGPRHLAFGPGIHHCLGAMLARMEGRIALRSLLDRFPNMELAVPPVELTWSTSILMRGLKTLPVRLEP